MEGRRRKISPFSVILTFACLSLIGLALVPRLPVKLAPSQVLPNISVQFTMHGSSPRAVEIEATSHLEAMLNRVDGIRRISSKSGNGWGSIHLAFDKHKDMAMARFEVAAVVRQTWGMLPDNVSYPSIALGMADNTAGGPILTYTVNAPAAPHEIQELAETVLKPQLALMEGVSRVDVQGSVPMAWHLEYDADILANHGVALHEVQRAMAEAARPEFFDMAFVPLAPRQKEWMQLAVRPQYGSLADLLARTGVRKEDGSIIALDKLLHAAHVQEQARSHFRINGLNSIYLSVAADERSNQLELGKRIKRQLAEAEKMLPQGYELHLIYDATAFIKKELDKIYFRAGLTLAILLSFMLLAYRNLKYTLLTVVSLFCNLTVAALCYYLLGLEIQLYSLAGITISLTLIIDNTIVMAEHILRERNLRAFMPIMAATVTTLGVLSVVFLMDEQARLNLQDFAMVMMVNLGISLFTALFLVPALLEKLRLDKPPNRKKWRFQRSARRFSVRFYRFYGALCRFLYRRRIPAVALLVLAFGLPVFMLPEKLEPGTKWATWYNRTLGSELYRESVAPYVNNALGGTLHLFVRKVRHGTYFASGEETGLQVNASLPANSTMEEMDGLIQQMEDYISSFSEVRQFRTNIYSAQRASIHVQFGEEHARGEFPYRLRARLIARSLQLGGGSWAVYGLGDAFSNDVKEMAGSYRAEMFGHNYDELMHWAETFKQRLLEHRRIREVSIRAEFGWFKDSYEEYAFALKKDRLVEENIQPHRLYEQMNAVFGNRIPVGIIPTAEGAEHAFLDARQARKYGIWDMLNVPVRIDGRDYKLGDLAVLTKAQMPKEVGKVDQQYRLCLQYEYIGASEQGRKVLDGYIGELAGELPLGYSVKNADPDRREEGKGKDYLLLLYVVVVVYFVCSILFNSFKKPLHIIFVIPLSFVGIFLAFYLFSVEFDRGGYASFILLSALTINANIYLVEEYGYLMKTRPGYSPLRAYLKACRAKMRPILLTVLSTVLGFVPFLIGDGKEAFWMPLAVGTMGGLVVSTLATMLFLPLVMGVGKKAG